MGIRVLKYGGTSVETPEHILAVARRILAARRAGDPVVVVVSAMGQTTDELLRLARRVSRTPSRREVDMLVTAGERISMALLAMALESLGCPAISFTGSQSGIITDDRHADARIHSVRAFRIRDELEKGRVVIVAGFQGVSSRKEITTLGRGGSDTTAVALAIHLGAERCEIYTDVPGVLSADPRVVPGARIRPAIDYDAMIVLSHLGGRVLFRRAVLLARKYGLPIEVLSSREEGPGTRIPPWGRPEAEPVEEEPMESDRFTGVALEAPVRWVRVTVPARVGATGASGASGVATGVAGGPSGGSSGPGGAPGDARGAHDTAGTAGGSGTAGSLPPDANPHFLCFSAYLLPNGTRVTQFASADDGDLEAWLDPARWGPAARIDTEVHAALLSLVGEGVVAAGGILRRVLDCLQSAGIEVWGVHTGTLSLSFVLPESQGEEAMRRLHREFIEGNGA